MGALSVCLGCAGFAIPEANYLLGVLLLLLLVFGVLDVRLLGGELDGLAIRRELPSGVGRNRPFEVLFRLDNSGEREQRGTLRDLPPLDAVPDLALLPFHIRPQEALTLTFRACIPKRGRHSWKTVWIRLSGRYGFMERQFEVECPGSVKVYPESVVPGEAINEHEKLLRVIGQKNIRRTHGEGLEFESITEYNRGDDPRHIDWRASARSRTLMVRRRQLERKRDVVILVDCGRLMGADAGQGSKLDRAVDSALLLSRAALVFGDQCGAGTFEHRVRHFVSPRSGPEAYAHVQECLYAVQSNYRESDFAQMFATLQSRQRKRSLIVVLSDITDLATSQRMRAALYSLSRRHVVLFTAIQTPVLSRYLDMASDSPKEVAEKAVALGLLRERERAVHHIRRMNITVLDVTPLEITTPLINTYLELRESGVL